LSNRDLCHGISSQVLVAQ